ncbi:MAG: tyrosine-type recombinase/integrase [Proteobacteria bacterium]|nr:tyrosine-type recombinase/integrase [Pseudomonadota bacterium]
MAKSMFTDRYLKGLPVPPKPDQVDYFDTGVRGLGLRVSYGGRKSFFVMYSYGGKRQRLALGEHGQIEHGKVPLAEARKQARAKLGEVSLGRNPAAALRAARAAPTVRQLAADFIDMQSRRGRKSAAWQERSLARDVLPALGDMRARDLTRADVKKIMTDITDRGAPVLANRVHEIIQAMLGYGLEEEVYDLTSNAADRLGKHRNPEHGRNRWLSLDELGAYWRALDEELSAPAAALRLCVLTAQRQGNVLGMRLDQLALNDRLWIVPASTTKTGKPYKVPLSTAAVGVIEARLDDLERTTWVFPNGRDGAAARSFNRVTHAAACARAGITDYRVHDHRHTFATHCEQMGISRLIWDPILGHSQNAMADLYSGFDFAEQRLDCMQKWADRIAAALGDNVVPIKQDSTA